MANPYTTYGDLKKQTAYVMGKSDYSTTDAVREAQINYSIREIYEEWPFKWTRASETLTISSYEADMPSDYNPTFPLVSVEDDDDNTYTQINPRDKDHIKHKYVYWIDYDTTNDVYEFHIPSDNTHTSFDIIYHFIPDELTADADKCVCPDPEAITYRAAAKTFLAKERDETNHDRLMRIAESRLMKMIMKDKKYHEDERVEGITQKYNLGFTRREL